MPASNALRSAHSGGRAALSKKSIRIGGASTKTLISFIVIAALMRRLDCCGPMGSEFRYERVSFRVAYHRVRDVVVRHLLIDSARSFVALDVIGWNFHTADRIFPQTQVRPLNVKRILQEMRPIGHLKLVVEYLKSVKLIVA